MKNYTVIHNIYILVLKINAVILTNSVYSCFFIVTNVSWTNNYDAAECEVTRVGERQLELSNIQASCVQISVSIIIFDKKMNYILIEASIETGIW